MYNRKYFINPKSTVEKVKSEVNRGLALLSEIDKPIVTVLGSHRSKPNSFYYKHASKLAFNLGKQGYAIVTGGGPGIMQAANAGANRAKAPSIGIKAGLIRGEATDNKLFTKHLSYHFLFIRRFILSLKSSALVFYPGALGTLNELFEYMVLVQLGFIDRVPIICVGKKYWSGLFKWLSDQPKKRGYYVHPKADLSLVSFADDIPGVMKLIQKSNGSRNRRR